MGEIETSIKQKKLEYLLNRLESRQEIVAALNLEGYTYHSDLQRGETWIIALEKNGFNNMTSAKLIAREKEDFFTFYIVSFEYDRSTYTPGDFSTYTGSTYYYNPQLQNFKIEKYKDGSRISITMPPLPSYSLRPPPEDDPCDEPGACQGGPDDPNDPTRPMMPPPDGWGGGNPEGYTSNVVFVKYHLNLNRSQADWLHTQPHYAQQLYNYLSTYKSHVTIDEMKRIAYDHILRMMSDQNYLSFVQSHAVNNINSFVWWEDDVWLSNTSNFHLDVNFDNNQYDKLTQEEKNLVKIYPLAAYVIKNNIPVAFNWSDTKMGIGPATNNKKDAFRHAFFNAINTRDVPFYIIPPKSGSQLVKLFADAHESEVPAELTLEKQMDLFNNQIGIDYCGDCYNTPTESIANAILQKLNSGQLKYLKPLDFVASPSWPAGKNGITSLTTLAWTNQ